ncbi:hypothetical protein [Streptomyces sp. NPDC056061]|uniref:hypothetical protein n=1 Tax=Streptomyces sp. NPDC056061 TaxID=3345700 RepID=UPI0035D718F1
MPVPRSGQPERDEPPTSGWLVDLSEQQQNALVGSTLNVFWKQQAATGLLLSVTEGVAHLYRPDQVEPLKYLVTGTRFERVPGTPMRPALAAALRYEHLWVTRFNALLTDGELRPGVSQKHYDEKVTEYEWGLPDVFSSLVAEAAISAFTPPTMPAKEQQR